MNKIHVKSTCCQALVCRFGHRRRQCLRCHRTWSIRPKKRGRKQIRVRANPNQFAGPFQESLRHKAQRLNKGRELVRRRHSINMANLLKLPTPVIPNGPYIAVIDGFLVFFNNHPYTTYIILIRPTSEITAHIMTPHIESGVESVHGWERAFMSLPLEITSQIQAIVTDGIVKIDWFAKKHGWILQRCHCHVIRTLYPLLGLRWKKTRAKRLRLTAFKLVERILSSNDEKEIPECLNQAHHLAKKASCPKRFGLKIRGVIRSCHDFRSYLNYPELLLPTNTNSVERVCGQITELIRRTRSFRNPKAYEKWVKLYLRLSPKIRCSSKIINRNNVS